MNCPNCDKNEGFELIETADDFQDGYIECIHCGKQIGTFNLTIFSETESQVSNIAKDMLDDFKGSLPEPKLKE